MVLQKQGISGLLNICTSIIICAKFELLCLEALPSQSPEPLCVIVTNIPFMEQTDNCIIFFAQATH